MPRRPAPHTYEIVIRTKGQDGLVLRTEDEQEAHRKYSAMRGGNRFPRLIMDGKDVPIYKADKMFPVLPVDRRCKSGYESDILSPPIRINGRFKTKPARST